MTQSATRTELACLQSVALPTIKPVIIRAVEIADPLFYLNCTEAEWSDYLAAKWGANDDA